MNKRWIMGLLLMFIVGLLAACAEEAAPAEAEAEEETAAFPEEPINVIVAYDAGGGTDTTARTLQPFLEEELGVPVNVVNQPGGSGWVGWTNIANAEPDGQTIGYLNSPNVASGLVNPTLEREVDLSDFETLANHVADPGAIAIRTDDERFSNFEELVEYAKENELTTTATGVAGDDHLVTLKLNDRLGTKFRAVQFEGTAESRAAFLGGHVDVLVTSVGEAYSMDEGGQLDVVAVTAEERSPFLPDTPTVGELGFDPIIQQSTRGLVAPVGIDPEKLEVLKAALENAIQNEEHQTKMTEIGTQVQYADAEEYRQLLEQDLEDVEGLKELLGW
ncbi:tripartite tricarboxylate transporter substrate binding protein [Indiicoccus explosivorum]|uniref:tripartite tricarboxylate transporter substrate binding protein n=1 Tax=Indiicoccus explosivorum TaxID=1917864 RepID=UPI000B42FF29|nr:tripartite tricarboxylate transporter substrate binding protein [Indiicoccus explosivorum]